ncbi:helix-turn-helix domain-containing protein [Hydrogenophaga intermedia]|nr:helix-turn-helix transcriptional regulator [Hydrogenophaga intermedia]
MSTESIHDYLLRRLNDLKGHHNRMAEETGVGQATVSRIFAGQAMPRLDTAQLLLNWIAAHDRAAARAQRGPRSARRVAHAGGARVNGARA